MAFSRIKSGFEEVLKVGGQKLANTAPAHQNKPPDHTAPDPPDASHSAAESAESPETILDCISGPP